MFRSLQPNPLFYTPSNVLHASVRPINEETFLRLLLLALQVLVREESDGAADEDQGVDAHAEAAGVGGLGCAAGRGRGGGGLRGGVACLFFRARVWVSEDWD